MSNTTDSEVHKVGPYLLHKVKPGPTSTGIDPTYAVCTADRWGLRYSDIDPQRPGQLMYPVARDFAKAVQTVLLDQVQWGDAYFGRAGSQPSLKLTWPITREKSLFYLLTPAITAALTGQTNGFGIPPGAVPAIVSYTPTNVYAGGTELGAFAPNIWTLRLNLGALKQVFDLGNTSSKTLRGVQLDALAQFVSVIYHEVRHCQQLFWLYALVLQHPDNFASISDIKEWPRIVNCYGRNPTDQSCQVVELAAAQPLPEDTAALVSLKRMAVGWYLHDMNIWRSQNYFTPGLPDAASMETEYQHTHKAAIDLLQHVGLGGAAVDVDAMLAEPIGCLCNYTVRPWENDAFFCGEMTTAYWNANLGQPLKTYPADECSAAYQYQYAQQQRNEPIDSSAGITNGGK